MDDIDTDNTDNSRRSQNRRSLLKSRRRYRDENKEDENKAELSKSPVDKEKERKARQACKNVEERYKIRRKKSKRTFLFSLLEDEEGNMQYGKWITVFTLAFLFLVILVVVSFGEEEYCTCDD